MKGLLNRGNLILAISWAMAVGVFVVRGRTDAGAREASEARHARAVQVAPDAAAIAAPVGAEPDEALSRNDSGRTLQ